MALPRAGDYFWVHGRATVLVVAIADIGVRSAGMSSEVANAMVGAAVLSVLIFPAAAQALLSRNTPGTAIEFPGAAEETA